MSNNSADKLNQLYSEMYILLQKEEEIRKQTAEVLNKAKAAIDPRREFNNWLKSSEGKSWKKKQFDYQECKCAYCGELLRFADAVVHHVLPLKKFGNAANKPENFKLLHPSCNLSIGTKIVEF
ncbi:MAG: HNH endonuclease [Cuspidothrix sp.]|jgi:5-methylcytosine-specific restriction endonuclease McrA